MLTAVKQLFVETRKIRETPFNKKNGCLNNTCISSVSQSILGTIGSVQSNRCVPRAMVLFYALL